MSKITSISTSVPNHKHEQEALFAFADKVYSKDAVDTRKLKFLYHQSGIDVRYSAIADFSVEAAKRSFFSREEDLEPFPSVEQRMGIYNRVALQLAEDATMGCVQGKIELKEITHLITVSCTGMSAPGLDLQLAERLSLKANVQRTSVNFMGCYAAIHGLKLANAFCCADKNAKILVVCVELCTLHFQKEITVDNITSSLLFADGCGAMLIEADSSEKGLILEDFYSEVNFKGKNEMAWQISSTGFLMTLTGYVPELIKQDFEALVNRALAHAGKQKNAITDWCIHPGGRKILDAIGQCLSLQNNDLHLSYDILKRYGNMSSATIVFVLKEIMDKYQNANKADNPTVFGAAFGPGLTMETFIASYA